MQPHDFYVKEKAEQGRRVSLSNPDGTSSSHWMVIRSVFSGHYEEAARQAIRSAAGEVMEIAASGSAADARRSAKLLARRRKARLVAALIADWSLTEECSEQEKTDFLIKAPRLRRQIEKVSESIFVESLSHE
jgi:hypothetical protein